MHIKTKLFTLYECTHIKKVTFCFFQNKRVKYSVSGRRLHLTLTALRRAQTRSSCGYQNTGLESCPITRPPLTSTSHSWIPSSTAFLSNSAASGTCPQTNHSRGPTTMCSLDRNTLSFPYLTLDITLSPVNTESCFECRLVFQTVLVILNIRKFQNILTNTDIVLCVLFILQFYEIYFTTTIFNIKLLRENNLFQVICPFNKVCIKLRNCQYLYGTWLISTKFLKHVPCKPCVFPINNVYRRKLFNSSVENIYT